MPETAARVRVPARYYARLGELLVHDGVDLPALLDEAGIQAAGISAADAMLHLQQVERFIAGIVARGARSDLAFDLGRSLKVSAHHLVGYGMLSSAVHGEAMRFLARYFRLVMPSFRAQFRVDERVAELRFAPTVAMSDHCLAFHLEAIAVAAHYEARALLEGDMPDYGLYLSLAEPPHAARYAELHEAVCHFGAEARPGVRLRFPVEIYHRPLSMADSQARAMAEERCQALLRNAVAAGNVSGWVAMMLREASGTLPTLTELAQILNISPRTLDRHLRREGCGYRLLANRVRNDNARQMLADGALSVTRIAQELGYSDAANFTRAFRRANGQSPEGFRKQLRA